MVKAALDDAAPMDDWPSACSWLRAGCTSPASPPCWRRRPEAGGGRRLPVCGSAPMTSPVGWPKAHSTRFCACSPCGAVERGAGQVRAVQLDRRHQLPHHRGQTRHREGETCDTCYAYVKISGQRSPAGSLADDVATLGSDMLMARTAEARRQALVPAGLLTMTGTRRARNRFPAQSGSLRRPGCAPTAARPRSRASATRPRLGQSGARWQRCVRWRAGKRAHARLRRRSRPRLRRCWSARMRRACAACSISPAPCCTPTSAGRCCPSAQLQPRPTPCAPPSRSSSTSAEGHAASATTYAG